MANRFVTATVAYTPPDASLGDIKRALKRHADVISIKNLYIRDFPEIKKWETTSGSQAQRWPITVLLPGWAV